MAKMCVALPTFLLVVSTTITFVHGQSFDKNYASMPEVFHIDNYDNCMLLEDEAFFCSLTYTVQPLDELNPSIPWKTIDSLRSAKYYNHDELRRWICVPKTCTNIPRSHYNNDTLLRGGLRDCFDKEHFRMGLRGEVSDVNCETAQSKYSVSLLDKVVAVAFFSYVFFVLFASFYEGIAKYQSPEAYEKITSTKFGRFASAFSLGRNWFRLKTIKITDDVERLRCIQGIRFYNMMIVTLSHSVLVFLITPVRNTTYVETITDKFLTKFLSSGGLCVSTFFLISTWLLTYNFFLIFEGKKSIDFKILVITYINRYIRLTPVLLVMIIFNATWYVHLFNGPLWDQIVGTEYKNCRNNGWLNLLYLQNYVQKENMCMQTTWYLGTDNQLFVFSLLVIWLMKKYESKIPVIISSLLVTSIVVVFGINYYQGYTGLILPRPESMYMLQQFKDPQFFYQVCSVIFNTGGVIVGFAFGYLYYRCKDKKLFTTKISVVIWWIITYSFPLGIIIIPGYLILDENVEPSHFWSSALNSLNRPLYITGIGLGIFGMSQGIGWMTKWVCEWSPTYILGRITYTAYLVQLTLIKTNAGTLRSPIYIHDYFVVTQTVTDICLSVIGGTLLTLFFEMPISELQKVFMSPELKGGGSKSMKKEK